MTIGAHGKVDQATTAARATGSFTSTGGSGAVMIVDVQWYGSGTSITSVTDNKGNTYTQQGSTVAFSGDTQLLAARFICERPTGGASHVITANMSNGGAAVAVYFVEILGCITSGTITDQTPAGNSDAHSNATPYVSATSGTTAQATECAYSCSVTYSASGTEVHSYNNGYTLLDELTNSASWTGASGYKDLVATGTQQSSLNATGSGATGAVTFLTTVKIQGAVVVYVFRRRTFDERPIETFTTQQPRRPFFFAGTAAPTLPFFEKRRLGNTEAPESFSTTRRPVTVFVTIAAPVVTDVLGLYQATDERPIETFTPQQRRPFFFAGASVSVLSGVGVGVGSAAAVGAGVGVQQVDGAASVVGMGVGVPINLQSVPGTALALGVGVSPGVAVDVRAGVAAAAGVVIGVSRDVCSGTGSAVCASVAVGAPSSISLGIGFAIAQEHGSATALMLQLVPGVSVAQVTSVHAGVAVEARAGIGIGMHANVGAGSAVCSGVGISPACSNGIAVPYAQIGGIGVQAAQVTVVATAQAVDSRAGLAAGGSTAIGTSVALTTLLGDGISCSGSPVAVAAGLATQALPGLSTSADVLVATARLLEQQVGVLASGTTGVGSSLANTILQVDGVGVAGASAIGDGRAFVLGIGVCCSTETAVGVGRAPQLGSGVAAAASNAFVVGQAVASGSGVSATSLSAVTNGSLVWVGVGVVVGSSSAYVGGLSIAYGHGVFVGQSIGLAVGIASNPGFGAGVGVTASGFVGIAQGVTLQHGVGVSVANLLAGTFKITARPPTPAPAAAVTVIVGAGGPRLFIRTRRGPH